MYRIYRKIPDSFQGDFEFLLKSVKKWYFLEDFLPILRLISWSLPDDEGGITCMNLNTCSLLVTRQMTSFQQGFGWGSI